MTEMSKGGSRAVSNVRLEDLDAFIMDLDGVMTTTARVHAAAWKRTFDDYLREKAQRSGEAFVPFDSNADYLKYVDGKPRYDGVKSFLESRHILLPYGTPDDSPEEETVCGIGNRKNRYYLELLERQGVEVYPTSVDLVRRLRSEGLRLGLISASRNTKRVLNLAGLEGLFDVVVDGIDSHELGLKGKPAPDIFLEAAGRLGVGPERSAIVEDALAGVEAGKAGGFAMVIGLDRTGEEEELRKRGADIVVRDLSELQIGGEGSGEEMLPSALTNLEGIFRRLQSGMPAVFLDYDGTLTPIVSAPPLAKLSEDMRNIVRELANNCLVAVVSGRDLEDVRQKIGLDNLVYVGSHGFETLGPAGSFREQRGTEFLPTLDRAEAELRSGAEEVKGALVERKKFAIALHYRAVDREEVPRLDRLIGEIARKHPDLKRSGGKKVFELHPNVDWDKGKEVLSLIDRFHVNGSKTVPLYIGDDETDEDAFRALADKGITILVSDHPLRTAAHYTVSSVAEVSIILEELVRFFEKEAAGGIWALRYEGFDPEREKLRETLCTVGNGYFATRGAAPESLAGDHHYPGTYLAGIYNRRESHVDGATIENESMVNVPNWLPLSIRAEEGKWFDLESVTLDDYSEELDIFRGVLSRTVVWTDAARRRTRLTQRRFVSMACPHLAGLQTTITPENWSGNLQVRSSLDGRVDNTLVERYRQLDNHHLTQRGTGASGQETIWLQAETNQSCVYVAEAARTRVFQDGALIDVPRRTVQELGYVGQYIDIPVREGRPVQIDKMAAIYSSKDRAISESLVEALQALVRIGDFDELCTAHEKSWAHLWSKCQIDVEGDNLHIAQILNLHMFHLLQTVSVHSIDLDVGVPPRGLHGEAYRGLIMWDELFIFPFLNFRIPDITRSLLLYRFRRMPRAQWAAWQGGHAGALFPWQSGSDGREEAQTLHLNPRSGRWIPDNTQLERHINLAVAYNVWHYYQVSGDLDFISFYGARMLIEIARFWASKVRFNESKARYEILKVMGPDEFHDSYPNAAGPGIDNNAYTNVMAAWTLCRALDALRLMPMERRRIIWEDLSLREEELDHWDDISRRMFIPFHGEGIISQFEGYEELEELDLDKYRKKYANVDRMDRILEAEGDDPNRYKISKQADVLMLFYLYSADELRELFSRLGYRLEHDTIPKNIEYYLARTSHGSTLSRVVHAWVLSRSNREASWNLFREALRSDVADIQGGTSREGIHLGAMAGTVDMILRCYSGLETRGDVLWLDPSLPPELKRMQFEIVYRGQEIRVEIGREKLRLVSRPRTGPSISIGFNDEVHPFAPGDTLEFPLD